MNEGKKDRRDPIRTVKPRNFVAKNASATTSGAGAHKDKKKAMKQGETKHKNNEYAESLERMLESALRDKEDYTEKRKALDTLSQNKDVDQKAVQQRRLDLDKEAKKKDMAEAGSPAQQAAIAVNMKKHHQKPKSEDVDQDEYSDEAGMSYGSLHTISRAANGLLDTIKEGDNLPEWCQEKISLAEDYLITVWDYLQSEKEQGVAEGKDDKIKQLKADYATAVHWSENERSPQKREAARRKALTIKAHLEKQYKQGVAEGSNEKSDTYRAGYQAARRKCLSGKSVESNLSGHPDYKAGYTQGLNDHAEWEKSKKKEQGVAEGSASHAELAKLAHNAYVQATRQGNGAMAAHYLKQHTKHKADATKEKGKQGVAEGGYNDYDNNRKGFSRPGREDDEYHVPDPDPELQRNRQETMMYNVTVGGKPMTEKPFLGRSAALAWAKQQVNAGNLDAKEAKLSPVQYNEGAKVDRQAKHITASMMKKGKNKKDAEAIAWAHIKHPKKKAKEGWTHDTLADQLFEHERTYEEQLQNKLNKQLGK